MKQLIDIIAIMALIIFLFISLPSPARSDGCSIYIEVFAFDGHETQDDYNGMSPLATYGFKCTHYVDQRLSVSSGYKHVSSVAYEEYGKGFNGFTFGANFKFVGW